MSDKKEMTPLKRYVRERWNSGRNFASAIGVSSVTIYKNCKEAKGAYTVIGGLYEELCKKTADYDALAESYAALSQRLTEITASKNENKVDEYLRK